MPDSSPPGPLDEHDSLHRSIGYVLQNTTGVRFNRLGNKMYSLILAFPRGNVSEIGVGDDASHSIERKSGLVMLRQTV